MKKFLLSINKAFLFACTSMYFGTGWSLVLFSFPVADQLTPDNYYSHIVPQFTAATQFFTYMTGLMLLSGIILIAEEWKSKKKWFPIGVLLAVVIATLLTTTYIIPYNARMSQGITDNIELHDILKKWMTLNVIRVLLWTVQWLFMMLYFMTFARAHKEG